ncbi:MAG: tetratricopeptide repeat protein [Thermoanaerobaculia bacterium]
MKARITATRSVLALSVMTWPVWGAQASERAPVPHPPLETMDPEVAEQLETARRYLDAATGDPVGTDSSALGEAFGRLGQLYMAYNLADAAEACLANAERLEPDQFRWSYLLGALLQTEGRHDEAERALAVASSLLPTEPATFLRLGQIALAREDGDGARRFFERVLRLANGSSAARYGLARVALLDDDPARARDLLETVVAEQPEAGVAHYQLGLAYRDLGERAKARERLANRNRQEVRFPDPLLEELTKLTRGASAKIAAAAAARAAGNLDAAVAAYREALATDPEHLAARMALAATLVAVGDAGGAIGEYQAVLARHPSDASVLYNLGTLLLRSGRLDEAETHLAEATRLAPDYADAWTNLATVLERQGHLEESAAAYARALENTPADTAIRLQRARVLERLGQPHGADLELARVLEAQPGSPSALFFKAELLAGRGDLETAVPIYGRLLERAEGPEQRATLHQRIGETLLAGGKAGDAVAHLEAAIAGGRSAPALRLALGSALTTTGAFERADQVLIDLIREQPASPEARFGRAINLILAGRESDAVGHLETSVDLLPEDVSLRHSLARLLATATSSEVREGSRALEIARDVYERAPNPVHAETIGMALAELGRFQDAAAWQTRILEASRAGGLPPALVSGIEKRLALYRAGEPCRAPWRE